MAGKKAKAPKPKSRGSFLKDFLQVLVMGLIFTALFGGGAYVASSFLGNTGSGIVIGAAPTSVPDSGTPLPTATPAPTNTPEPCDAQAWWDTAGANVALVDSNASLDDAESEAYFSDLDAKIKTFEQAEYPSCAAAAHDHFVKAITGYLAIRPQMMRTDLTSQNGMVDMIRTVGATVANTYDSYAAGVAELKQMGVVPQTEAHKNLFASVERYNRINSTECPAFRWFADNAMGYMGLISAYGVLTDEGKKQLSGDALQMMSASARQEADRIRANTNYPACVEDLRQSMADASQEFAAMLDAMFFVKPEAENHFKNWEAYMRTLINEITRLGIEDFLQTG